VNAKRCQPTLIQDRNYVGAICTKNINYFNTYVRVRAYAKKREIHFLSLGGNRAIMWGGQKQQQESRLGRSNFCLKSNRDNLFGPEEVPENPSLLSVSHAIETYSAQLFSVLMGYNGGS
jgi:hypothetical protein